ncbi:MULTISPECIES: hypothetical protein [Staphylococcus]|uniref:hypothetical protein n=1 Tax=Staphylococcus TaxID=1279 RepID=UPI00298F34E1|nr:MULTISPECIES: hypothetical protein [Staphylococcus]MDW8546341.1 hypothetical protein [Staphylococcus pseudoxylosus]MDW8567811.1 hypothetical protein [Staphylococcus shinii]
MAYEFKKVIYYYYDEESNRRPIDVDDYKSLEFQLNKQMFEKLKEYYPEIENNYYAQVDGKEFKIS